jgi:hypothetical protein
MIGRRHATGVVGQLRGQGFYLLQVVSWNVAFARLQSDTVERPPRTTATGRYRAAGLKAVILRPECRTRRAAVRLYRPELR